MNRTGQELLFYGLIVLAAGIAHVSYLLGVGVDPLPTLVIGSGLVLVGVIAVVPQHARIPAGIIGLLGTGIAGAIVPRYAARAVRPGNTLWFSLLLAGVVLLLTVAVLRMTMFRPRTAQSA